MAQQTRSRLLGVKETGDLAPEPLVRVVVGLHGVDV
jgi:hypothetical protein